MARTSKAENWTLADLADFETLLAEEEALQGARRIYRDSVAPHLSRDLDEGERRRQGLRLWLEAKREEVHTGERIESGLRLAGMVVVAGALLAGMGLSRGVLQEMPLGEGRGYNVWLFLGLGLGLQWLFLLGGGLTWLLLRKKNRLSWSQELLALLGRKFAGSRVGPVWARLQNMRSEGYGSVLGWRLARLSQVGAVWFNFGIIVSFLACLLFLKVNFYWESTLASLSESQLVGLTQGLSLPWSWLGEQWRPGPYGVAQTQLEALGESGAGEAVNRVWMRFFVLSLLVWGVLPRLILSFYARSQEKQVLAALDFQESRHRNLWREMAKVERAVVKTSQADGVVLLDVGGAGLPVEAVRPFLLQQMRVNPASVHQTGVLDATKEKAAEEAMREAELGVVLAVEGWSLSGPQMTRNYEKVRAVIGDKKPIRFLVIGTVKGEQVTEADDTEMAEWIKFVDGLRDPAVEVVKFEV
ncbi:DUF2868 domain-containing protein [Roseibacillus ishigakijimensis]|uniref:DUF2868 domain-containing protein n=1 Tax=Roseibacillus ishigakijimensis TaxID=454146 RepID=A0A934RM77_9BACT|nr:DUF2868 domain-containing protein [Roseibacillus ishigakijimensis]MBK1833365.1 DUF2868 domain-containing protein [Roseibacillus ishigakijimensis]